MALKNPTWKITVYDSGPFVVGPVESARDITEREMEFLIRDRRFGWKGYLEAIDIEHSRMSPMLLADLNQGFVVEAFTRFYAFAAVEKLFESV